MYVYSTILTISFHTGDPLNRGNELRGRKEEQEEGGKMDCFGEVLSQGKKTVLQAYVFKCVRRVHCRTRKRVPPQQDLKAPITIMSLQGHQLCNNVTGSRYGQIPPKIPLLPSHTLTGCNCI